MTAKRKRALWSGFAIAVGAAGMWFALWLQEARGAVVFCNIDPGPQQNECAHSLTVIDENEGISMVFSSQVIFMEGFE